MRWKNQCCFFRNEQVALYVEIIFLQLFYFGAKNDRIENDPVSNYIFCFIAKNSRRYLMKHMFNSIKLECMTRVWSALKARDYIVFWCKDVNNFPFAFIAPLKT